MARWVRFVRPARFSKPASVISGLAIANFSSVIRSLRRQPVVGDRGSEQLQGSERIQAGEVPKVFVLDGSLREIHEIDAVQEINSQDLYQPFRFRYCFKIVSLKLVVHGAAEFPESRHCGALPACHICLPPEEDAHYRERQQKRRETELRQSSEFHGTAWRMPKGLTRSRRSVSRFLCPKKMLPRPYHERRQLANPGVHAIRHRPIVMNGSAAATSGYPDFATSWDFLRPEGGRS